MGKSRFEKHCILCGTKYEYCGNCDRFKNYPRWMETLHNENCYNIFETIMKYKAGVLTSAQAANDLKNYDLSYRDKFSEKINLLITVILADGVEAKVEEEVAPLAAPEESSVEEPVVVKEESVMADEEPIVVEVKAEEKHEDHKSEKKNFNYKKNYKK